MLHEDLLRVFLNTPILNGVIVGVLVIGIFFVMRQVISLWPEVRWLRRFQHREQGAPPARDHRSTCWRRWPPCWASGRTISGCRRRPRAPLLDGIATRLDERRELTRYLIGLLIFLGLLGTFWGLLETIGAVADAINGLQVTGGDAVQMFAKLKASIDGPLKGMATAFGASLFGLSGSLVLGFLELQASQAQGRFHIELEEWLAGATRLSSGSLHGEGEQGVSAYVEALLERTADGLDDLTRTLRRSEESREATAGARRHAGRASGRPGRDHARPANPACPPGRAFDRTARHGHPAVRAVAGKATARRLQTHQRNIEAQPRPPASRKACAAAPRWPTSCAASSGCSPAPSPRRRGQSLPPGEG